MSLSRLTSGWTLAILAIATLVIGVLAATQGQADTTVLDDLSKHVGPYAG